MVMYAKDRCTLVLIIFGILLSLFLIGFLIYQSVALGECTTDCSKYLCSRLENEDNRNCKADIYPPMLAVNIIGYFLVPVGVAYFILKGLNVRWKATLAYVLVGIVYVLFASMAIWYFVAHIMYWSGKGMSVFDPRSRAVFVCGNNVIDDGELKDPNCLDLQDYEYVEKLNLLYYADAILVVVVAVALICIIVYAIVVAVRACRYGHKSISESLKWLHDDKSDVSTGDYSDDQRDWS